MSLVSLMFQNVTSTTAITTLVVGDTTITQTQRVHPVLRTLIPELEP